MKSDRSEIVVVLDRSGSMQEARKDHEGGLNSFVADQRGLAGEVTFTLIQFDTQNPCEVVYDGVPIADVGPCELVPRGGTPLLDAVGRAVAHVAKRIDARSPKPDQVLVMIITDGEENESREWTKAKVAALVKEREATHGWKFLFLGANVDAFAEAGSLGVAAWSTSSFVNNRRGVAAMYHATTANTLSARQAVQSGLTGQAVNASYNYSDTQRSAMADDAEEK